MRRIFSGATVVLMLLVAVWGAGRPATAQDDETDADDLLATISALDDRVSALETQVCTLSDEPVMVPEFQGAPPDQAFRLDGGPCTWTSDYWWNVADSPVYADSFSYVVTPAGAVRATSTYSAVPLACE